MTDRRTRFEEMYAQSIDPWGFRTSPYEREKYLATVKALPRAHYRCAVEAGCSIGELSRMLANHCDAFVGIDLSQTAIDAAVARNFDKSNMTFLRAELPAEWPIIDADLIVLSEILYFLAPKEIDDLAQRIEATWLLGGDCVIVSFLGETSEPMQGADAADMLIRSLRDKANVGVVSSEASAGYRLDILHRVDASV